MGKKILKRSLVIGLLMAFVITGNAWADNTIYLPSGGYTTVESFSYYCQSGLNLYYDKNYSYCYPSTSINNNSLETTGYIKYEGKYVDEKDVIRYLPFFLDAGLSFRDNSTSEVTVSYCELEINSDITSKKAMEIYGGQIASSSVIKYKRNVCYNKACINNATIASEDSYVIIGGGHSNINIIGAKVEHNSVEVINGNLNSASVIEIVGGSAYAGYSLKNSVVVEKCTLNNALIWGGYSQKGSKVKEDVNFWANKNTVYISDTSLKDCTVYGGQAINGDAKYNIVNITNSNLQGSSLYGGDSDDGSIVSGNTLNIAGNVKGDANTIGGFATINYDDLKWNTKVPVLETTNLVLDSNGKITANVNGLSNGSTPKKGEVMTLLDTGKVMFKDKNFEGQYLDESTSTFNSGSFLKAEGKIYQEAEDIKLKITRVGTNDQTLVIDESRVAATAFVNQGSELIEIGLDTLARDKSDKETKVFASVFGNTSEYTTGSHVKVNGWSGIVGVAKTNDDGLTTGAFFENGEGNYRTFNIFEGDFMRGDGEANYNGGGFFARKDNANGVYTEASLRAGNLQNELRKAVITDNKLEGYDIDTFYYGAHVGIGKIIPRGSEGDSIDVYGKFIYTHHDSEDFAIGGDDFHFDSIDSERLRLGFRINEVQNDKMSMYYGAAWEYEFNGDANNTVVGYYISTPSLGGSTVIGEIGAHYKANEKWTFDANLRGYSGQRDGFTGSVQANYAF